MRRATRSCCFASATRAPRLQRHASDGSRLDLRWSGSPPARLPPSASASSRPCSRTSSRPAETNEQRISEPTSSPAVSLPRKSCNPRLLLNLVNFGGGCYTVYAEVDDDTNRVHVDKELYGDVFRKAPKLTLLEARAIRLAIEYVGPTIAADAHTPLDRVRLKLEETFGQFNLAPAKASQAGDDEEALVRTLSNGADERRLVELEYLKEGDEEPSTRLVEPYTIERELPYWRVHTWDRTVDGPRTYRLDRMRSARLTKERFEPRIGFDPNYLSEPAVAQLWHAPPIARWKLERGARALTDRSARSEVTFKTEEWLLSEVLADRGETVVFEPESMRRAVAARARALQAELGLSPRRKRTVEPA